MPNLLPKQWDNADRVELLEEMAIVNKYAAAVTSTVNHADVSVTLV